MRGRRQILVVLLGLVLLVGGVALLLVFAQYETTFLIAGVVATVAGVSTLLLVPRENRFNVVWFYVVAVVLPVGMWSYARFGPTHDAEPTVPSDTASASGSLEDGLRAARDAIDRLDQVADYTFTVAKRERAKNLLGAMYLTDVEVFVKIRHTPFSVYARYLRPEAKEGTEAIYVEGSNDGNMIAHSTAPAARLMGTVKMQPTDWRATIDERYPITYAGLRNLALALVALAEDHPDALAKCTIARIEETVGDRPCSGIEIRNDAPSDGFDLAHARFLFDPEWKVPVRMQRWNYVEGEEGLDAQLVEDYAVTDVRFDVGLTDADFDPQNPEYGYPTR